MQNCIPKYLEEKEIPTKNYEKISLEKGKELKIGKKLNTKERESLKEVLKKNLDIFAWDRSQVHGINRDIIEHKLSTNSTEKPVKQRLRTLGAERKKSSRNGSKKNFCKRNISKVSR